MKALPVMLVRVAFVAGLVPLFLACTDLFRKEVIWTLTSPDGRYFVSVLRDGGGGAWSSFNYGLILVPTEDADRFVGTTPPSWESSGCAPIYIFWSDSKTLTVFADMERPRCANETFVDHQTREGITIRTRNLHGTDWSDVVAAMAGVKE